MQRIFISSVQKEFAAERTALGDYLRTSTGDMIERCIAHGLPEPIFGLTDGFVTTIRRKPGLALAHGGGEIDQGTPQVRQLLTALQG